MRISQQNENNRRQKSHQSPSSHQEKTPNNRLTRLRKRRDFALVQRSASRLTGQFLLIEYRFSQLPYPRLGITVSKRYGKAHDRNRFKRLVREAFRLSKSGISRAVDLNILPKRGTSPQRLADCTLDFEKLIHVIK